MSKEFLIRKIAIFHNGILLNFPFCEMDIYMEKNRYIDKFFLMYIIQ